MHRSATVFVIRLIRAAKGTFESERPLGGSNEPDDEDRRRTMHVLTIASLLPSDPPGAR
jgi:hypothetical protein